MPTRSQGFCSYFVLSFAESVAMRYIWPMTETKTRAMPSPLPPTEAELAEWNALSREEQVARYREALSHPACDIVTETTMAEILSEARARVAARHG
jgi:hypothetical protein